MNDRIAGVEIPKKLAVRVETPGGATDLMADSDFAARVAIFDKVNGRNSLARARIVLETINAKGGAMATCETCGNDYDKSFQVTMNGKAHTFDSFECAIHALAPTCDHCGIRIVGHGLEKSGTFYCCDHCAEREGVEGLRDRV